MPNLQNVFVEQLTDILRTLLRKDREEPDDCENIYLVEDSVIKPFISLMIEVCKSRSSLQLSVVYGIMKTRLLMKTRLKVFYPVCRDLRELLRLLREMRPKLLANAQQASMLAERDGIYPFPSCLRGRRSARTSLS